MKTFKIKDLMVSIATTNNQGPVAYCPQQTCVAFTPPLHNCCKMYTGVPSCNHACSFVVSLKLDCPGNTAIHCTGFSCAGGSRITDFITRTDIEQELVLFQEAELAELKVQLSKLQLQVDVQLQRSPEELDELEIKLTDAVKEIREQKGNITKGKKSS